MTRRPYRPARESTRIVLDDLVYGARSANELAARTDLSPWTVRQVLGNLAADGHVKKAPGVYHRAGNVGRWGYVWRITPEGRTYRKELRK